MLGVALPQADQEVGDHALPHLREVGDPPLGEVGAVAPQVAPVGGEGVGGDAALDHEVVEVGAHRPLDGSGSPGHGGCRHARTVSGSTASIPTASPTGLLVSEPAWVLSPLARLASSVSAWRQPLLASATV